MKISEKSWHYRFNDLFFDTGHKYDNLCGYFWATVIHVILIVGLSFAIVLATICLMRSLQNDPWGWAIGISVALCLAGPPLAIHLFRKRYPPIKTKTKVETLTGEYYKAFKGKYCPRIEYTWGDE